MRFPNVRGWLSFGMATALLACGLLVPAAVQKQKAKKPVPRALTFSGDIRPFVNKYCVGCHGGDSPAAGISLAKFTTETAVRGDSDTWAQVAENLSSGHMPPNGVPHPSTTERSGVVAWIQAEQALNCKLADPGRVTMSRLNRVEYDNTVRDLTGLELHLASDFPSDDVGYGFDNVGDVLSISPLLMEKYIGAAEKISKAAISVKEPKISHFEGDMLKNDHAASLRDTGDWIVFSNGSMYVDFDFPHTGSYLIRVRAAGQQAGPEPAKMAVHLDKAVVQSIDVKATEAKPDIYEVPVRVEEGRHRVAAEFTNDYYRKGPPVEDRNLVVYSIEISSPRPAVADVSETEKRIITHAHGPEDRKAAAEFLKAFASRAWRRPATPMEVDRLAQIADLVMKDGQPFERAMQVGVEAVLASPNFIFRVERNDNAGKLDGYELATRLSYFLWNSMPDDRLESLAASGELVKPDVLKREAMRMLSDPRAHTLGDNFGGQWLNLRKLPTIFPDPQMFPDFSDKLRDDMMTETKMFFQGIVENDRSVLDFLDAKYSYMNGRLAEHYGITGVTGDQFRKVSLEGTPRAGVLTQASVLTLTSNPTRTSPVKRGKWVLEELFNAPPPPPPPGVGNLKDDGKPLTGATLRARMEQHRKDPMCAACHMKMDPIGFGLENFDATGKWRTEDANVAIDPSGVLPDGTKFKGPADLTAILSRRKEDFVKCISEKLLTYALGRGVDSADRCHVAEIANSVKAHDYRFSSLVAAIVTSDPFRMRRAAAPESK